MKISHIRPHLKKPSLVPDILTNHHPVSNLTFLSKLLEKIVATQLDKHLTDNLLMDTTQSAYRHYHSTETALLKVQTVVLELLDNGFAVVLLMLDLSSAFDTIDHTLLHCLQHKFGITSRALAWFKSYLTGRSQSVLIGENQSEAKILEFTVPQGSVLGPKVYCVYTRPVGDIVRRHGLSCHTYADDTQIYFSLQPISENWSEALINIENVCLKCKIGLSKIF